MNARELLSPKQVEVADRVLTEESLHRAHVVVHLSGAHAYGFPSPDGDLDLKAIHVARTRALVGLAEPRLTFDRAEVIEGVEIDYTSNELGPVLGGVLQGNGNFLERVLGSTTLETSPWHEPLRPLVRATLSKRVHRHYRGFATSQRKSFAAAPTPEKPEAGGHAKQALYVLRTTLTGANLLATGELVIDVNGLLEQYGFGHARELIAAKRAGERTTLGPPDVARWNKELDRAFETLDAAEAASSLPREPSTASILSLESWLLDVRRTFFDGSREGTPGDGAIL